MTHRSEARSADGKSPFVFWKRMAVLPAALFFLAFLLWGAAPCCAKEPLSVSGVTEPIRDVTLSATVVGTISAIFVKEGMTVQAGAAILELDKKLEDLEVQRRKLIWESKAELEAAAARVTTLKSLLESTRDLFNSTGSVSKEELEKLALEYDIAVSEQKRLDSAEERERIEYEMARETLRKRSLISPIQGTVIKLFLDEGETCQEKQPLAQVVDTSRGILVCNVEEAIGRTLRKGEAVDLKIKTGNGTAARKGVVVFVSPVVDPASGLLEVKAEFDNQDGSVRPGVAGFLLLRTR
jgi:membrane fusion protein, multidrug efflux system